MSAFHSSIVWFGKPYMRSRLRFCIPALLRRETASPTCLLLCRLQSHLSLSLENVCTPMLTLFIGDEESHSANSGETSSGLHSMVHSPTLLTSILSAIPLTNLSSRVMGKKDGVPPPRYMVSGFENISVVRISTSLKTASTYSLWLFFPVEEKKPQ